MHFFFERKPTHDEIRIVSYDLSDPLPRAIVATTTVIERKLEASRLWLRKARTALDNGDLRQHIAFLVLARKVAEEATALMESADLLHEEILNQAR